MSAMPGATKETYSLSGCSPEVCAEPGEAEKAPEGRKGDMGMGRNWVSNDANEHKKPMNPYESLVFLGNDLQMLDVHRFSMGFSSHLLDGLLEISGGYRY